MEKKNNNEELQNRREFFKKAAQKVLPILGTIIVGPTIITSTLTSCDCDDCSSSCSSNCDGTSTIASSTDSFGTETPGSSCTGSSCSNACSSQCSNNCTGQATGVPSLSDASGNIDGYEYVDLGLSVKWARYNIGATKPESYGKYFAFADPTGNNVYSESSAKNYYRDHSSEFYAMFNYGNKSVCGTNYDSATYQWSNKWRMPTKAEFEELANNCDISFESYNGISGYKFTSKKNSNSIFLPAAGFKLSDNEYKLRYDGDDAAFWAGDGTYFDGNWGTARLINVYVSSKDGSVKIGDWFEYMDSQLTIRPVTTGSANNGGSNGDGGACSSCSTGCSSGCKDSCTGNCANTCKTGCGGGCNSTCGGTCTYLSRGSSCSGCATTCYNRCYTTCTLACSNNCQSSCVYGSK